MTDYWDHEEYGELEKELEKQVATTRKWMALHDEAVEREATLTAEVADLKVEVKAFPVNLDHYQTARDKIESLTAEVSRLKAAIGDAICNLDDIPGASGTSYDLENVLLDSASGKQSSEFSRFIREGTTEEKAEVFERVIDESNKAQQDTVDSRPTPLYEDLVSDLKAHDHCGDECVVCDLIAKSELALTRLLTERADRWIATDHAEEQNND